MFQTMRGQKRTLWLLWIFGGIAIVATGFFVLRQLGNIFIEEVVQEVAIERELEDRDRETAQVEKPVLEWELPDLEGNLHESTELAGDPFVVTFWTTWNSFATDQFSILDEYFLRHDEKLFRIITINSQEDRSVVANFIRRGGYKVRVLLDESGAVSEKFEAFVLPVSFFIDRKGMIRDVFIGVLSQEMLEQKAEQIVQ